MPFPENWNRPKLEVDTLMKILIKSLKKELVLSKKIKSD
jgi:undecaprenyl diphosphate synthase